MFSRLSRGLANRGHDVSLVCSTSNSEGREVEDGVRRVRVPRTGTLFRDPVVNLSKRIPEETDLVHVAATYPFTTPTVLGQARSNGTPAVLDFHFEPRPNTLLGKLGARVYRSIGTRTYDWAEAVLVRSRAYASQAPSLDRVPEDRLRVLPNGVDTTRFQANGGGPQGEYVLSVGRLVPYKGIGVLLEALAEDPPPVPLLVAGEGPLRDELEQKAKRLDVDARFLGRVPDEDLPGLYRGACVTVLPSVNRQEAFGITLVESMACGTPVVASKLPGVEDVAGHGGIVAPPGDAKALSRRLKEALTQETLPEGEDLASRVHRRFSWEAITERLEAIYEEVLAGEREPPG